MTTTAVTRYRELAQRMSPVCAEAVDDMEIAAVLEADGVTDALADRRFGSPDVFHLARRLRAETPSRPVPTRPQDGPWRPTVLKHLLRGGLFGLPALCYQAVSGVADGRRAVLVLVVSVLLSWAVSQGLAYVGHVRLGWGDAAGSARVLRAGLLAGLVAVPALTAATAAVLSVPLPVVLIAVAQVVYLLAATVALVLGAEWLLLAALAPGVFAALVGLALGGDAVRSAPVVGFVVLTVLASVVVAGYATRGARPGLPTRRELTAALPSAGFGVAVGGLLLFVPAARSLPPAGWAVLSLPGAAASLAALVPLSVSMGFAEWLLVDYRARGFRALQLTGSLSAFARRAGAAFAGATAIYLTVLLTGCAAAAVLVVAAGQPSPDLAALAGYLTLGGALFVGLTLMSFQVRGVAVAACALAGVVEIGLLTVVRRPEAVQLGVTLVLFLVLLGYALRVLGRATRHL